MLAYSRAHGMVNQWDFLTGSLPQLEAVWRAYHIYVQIVKGQVDHTPAVFIIDARGREQKVYLTTMAYASIGQAAQLTAAEVSSLLPSHPSLISERSLGCIGGISPTTAITLPTLAVPGRPAASVGLGPGKPHLVMFFASWLDETSDLKARLLALNSYVSAAKKHGLPGLAAVDEAREWADIGKDRPSPAERLDITRYVVREPAVPDLERVLALLS